jgi:hypothetical protein
MPPIRSRRLRLLEGMCRTVCDLLHERVGEVARSRGWLRPPESTSAIYALAATEAPGLLDQLFQVHFFAGKERGEVPPSQSFAPPTDDGERRKMLSAIRAAVGRTQPKFAR